MGKSQSRRIVLTGVSRGLGLAMAEGFIAAGHTVFGCARGAASLAELGERFGVAAHFAAVDVADDAQVARWADAVLSAARRR